MSLSMYTAKCEGCGCDWNHPCNDTSLAALLDGPSPCRWDPTFWRRGRAVCSVCVSEGRVPA